MLVVGVTAKLRRLRRKRLRFRRRRKEIKAASHHKAQQLSLSNLSDMNINEHQITVLREGPTFCPSPKDVNWQLVHDDLEAFEARLKRARRSHIICQLYQVTKIGDLCCLNIPTLNVFFLTLENTY